MRNYFMYENKRRNKFVIEYPKLFATYRHCVNRSNWSVTQNSVICIKHFEEKFLLRGNKRTKLNWKLSPIPRDGHAQLQK